MMKRIIGLGLLALIFLVLPGCLTQKIPDSVLGKYEEARNYSNHLTLGACSKGNDTFYLVASDVEVDGPTYYYDKDGAFLGTSGYGPVDENLTSKLPADFQDYRCELLKESRK